MRNKIKLIVKALLIAFMSFWLSTFTITFISIKMINVNADMLGCTLALLFCISFCTLLIIDNLKEKKKEL